MQFAAIVALFSPSLLPKPKCIAFSFVSSYQIFPFIWNLTILMDVCDQGEICSSHFEFHGNLLHFLKIYLNVLVKVS